MLFPKPKREAIELKPSQIEATQKAASFLGSGNKVFLLSGHAGTGKTTVLGHIAKDYLSVRPTAKIAFCALSNKAVRVLRSNAKFWKLGASVKCLTVCALLGLKPKIDQTGAQKFVPDSQTPPTVSDYDLVVVDECSMINEAMHELLMQNIANFLQSTKLMYVGDPAQLKPINEDRSPSFRSVPEDCHAHLGEVIRYEGSVGVLAEEIRSNLDWAHRPVILSDYNDDMSKGIFLVSRAQFNGAIYKAFSSPSYDPDNLRVLAWRNATVDSLNEKIHQIIYGQNAPRFVEGMTIVANKPVFSDGQKSPILMPTSEEAVIKKIHEGTEGERRIYTLEVQIPDKFGLTPIRVLHESEHARFEYELKQLKDARAWPSYYDLLNRWANVGYAYAGTTHKSQGSTYRDVFIDLTDMRYSVSKGIDEFRALAYVAFTRPSHRVFVVSN